MVIQARLHLAHFLAEAQHHAELVRLDLEEAGEAPQRDRRQSEQREALAAHIAAGQHAPQFVLAAAEDFLEIGRLRAAWRLRSGAPGALAARAPRAAATAALIGPWHVK